MQLGLGMKPLSAQSQVFQFHTVLAITDLFYIGVVIYYCTEQVGMWIVLHTTFLFWGVVFPFSYRELRVSGRIRYAHIISVLLALIVPLLGALAPLKDGYVITRNPTLACQGRNSDHTYYTFILPATITLCITSCLLAVTFWTLFKVGKGSYFLGGVVMDTRQAMAHCEGSDMPALPHKKFCEVEASNAAT